MTALLEYLSVLLEYIDLFSIFSKHLYDIASYKLFLLAKSNLSFSLLLNSIESLTNFGYFMLLNRKLTATIQIRKTNQYDYA